MFSFGIWYLRGSFFVLHVVSKRFVPFHHGKTITPQDLEPSLFYFPFLDLTRSIFLTSMSMCSWATYHRYSTLGSDCAQVQCYYIYKSCLHSQIILIQCQDSTHSCILLIQTPISFFDSLSFLSPQSTSMNIYNPCVVFNVFAFLQIILIKSHIKLLRKATKKSFIIIIIFVIS